MKVVGLTGGIGSGKSTVSAALREKGAEIVDADAITKDLQRRGQPVFEAMVERFGEGIVGPDGELDRPAVAAIVFGDPEALQDLNAIVHPAVGVEIARRLEAAAGTDRVVILDIPLLVEGGRHSAGGILVVDCPVDTAVDRLVRQRGMDEADAQARVSRQASRDERLAEADFVIDNGGSHDDLAPQVEAAWTWIQGLPDAA